MTAREQSLSRFTRRSLLFGGGASLITLATTGPALAAPRPALTRYSDGHSKRPAWLIDATSLMHVESVKVVAMTPADEFETGHIPGAGQIDWPDLLVGVTDRTSIDRWRTSVQARLRELNIAPGDTVVVYDGGSFLAPRFWWALDALGHRDTRILNGGLAAWKAAGGTIERGPSTVTAAGDAYLGVLNQARIMTQGEVMMALGDPDTVLLDARDPAEFRSGRIPGAINYHFLNNADGGPAKVWKTKEHLAAVYTSLGITPDKRVAVYCSTGTRACSSYFTLRLIGYPDVRVYAGSWDEWVTNPYAPREAGDA